MHFWKDLESTVTWSYTNTPGNDIALSLLNCVQIVVCESFNDHQFLEKLINDLLSGQRYAILQSTWPNCIIFGLMIHPSCQ